MKTLQLIASRTGVDVHTFLLKEGGESADGVSADVLEVGKLEALCARGRYADVVGRVAELRGERTTAWLDARLDFWAGQAHVHLHEPSQALILLARARERFERARDEWMAVECLALEATALTQAEDRSAPAVGLEALRRCKALDPVPAATVSRIFTTLAAVYISQHQWERAVEAYRGALNAAGAVRDLGGMSKIYDGLAIAYQGLGDLASAAAYGQRAIALASVASNEVALARLEGNFGLLMLRSRQWEEAEEHLGQALALCNAGGIHHGKCHVLLSLVQLAATRGEMERAQSLALEAVDLAAGVGAELTQALGYQWLGKILAATGDALGSDRCFDLAFALLARQGVPRRSAECHSDYAEILERRGDLVRAIEHLREAASLWQAPLDATDALDWAQPADIAT